MGDRAALEGAVIHDGDDEDLGGGGESYAATGRTSGAEPQKLLSKGICRPAFSFRRVYFFVCHFAFGVSLSEYILIF